MQYPLRPIGTLVLFLLICLLSCESDPDIMNNEAPNSLFVWGYADMQSGLHQVRIREAIQEEGNMYELAQDPEQTLPTDNLLVNLILYTPSGTVVLKMNPVVYPKDDGIFSDEQNIIHEVEYPIPKGTSCAIQVINLVTGDSITSEIEHANAPGFLYPRDNGWFVPKYHFTNVEEPFHITFNIYHDLIQKLVTEIKYVDLLFNGDIEPTHSFPDTLSSSPETLDLKFSRYIYQGIYIHPDHE